MLDLLRPATIGEILAWERRYDGPLPSHLRDALAAGAGDPRRRQALAASRALDRLARHHLTQLAARRRNAADLAQLTHMARRLSLFRRAGLALRQAAAAIG
jgi:hypothetical protein